MAWKKTIFNSLAALLRKILFLPLENKIHIFAPPCNILYICCYSSIIFYTLSLNCNVFALRVILCNTLKKKGCAFWNIGKIYTVSLPLNQHCFFYRIWFFIFCWLDPLLQDPVLLFCYGGLCKVYCFRQLKLKTGKKFLVLWTILTG